MHEACCIMQEACCMLREACCMLRVAGCMLRVAGCMLRVARCRLRVAKPDPSGSLLVQMWQEQRAVLALARKRGLTACKEAEARGTEVYRVELVLVPGTTLNPLHSLRCLAVSRSRSVPVRPLTPPSCTRAAFHTAPRRDSTAHRIARPSPCIAYLPAPTTFAPHTHQRRRLVPHANPPDTTGSVSKARGRRRWPTARGRRREADGDGRIRGADVLAAQQPEDEARVPCRPCGPIASLRAAMHKM